MVRPKGRLTGEAGLVHVVARHLLRCSDIVLGGVGVGDAHGTDHGAVHEPGQADELGLRATSMTARWKSASASPPPVAVAGVAHAVQGAPHRHKIPLLPPLGGQRLDRNARHGDIEEGLLVLQATGVDPQGGGNVVCNEGPGPPPGVDEALVLQAGDGLANDGPADLMDSASRRSVGSRSPACSAPLLVRSRSMCPISCASV
jgi:hypothetical protein